MSNAIKLPASLTMASTAQCQLELSRRIGSSGAGSSFEIDASALQELDSSALALLLDVQRQAHERGLSLSLRGLPAQLMQLAALYGVSELLAEPSR